MIVYQLMFPESGVIWCSQVCGLSLLPLVFSLILTVALRLLHPYCTDDKTSRLMEKGFSTVQLSHPHMTTGQNIALTRWTFVDKVVSLLLNMLSRLVITFLPRNKRLLKLLQNHLHLITHYWTLHCTPERRNPAPPTRTPTQASLTRKP